MLKPRRPSPAMVVACVALAITLSGVGYAAALAKNSVGSAQVKPDSLNGTDIKESTPQGRRPREGHREEPATRC